MLDTKPLQLQDGWPVANLGEAHLDPESLSELTQWIEEVYEYQNTHAVLIEHAGHLVYELYLEGQDERWGDPIGYRTFSIDSLHDLQSVSKSVTSLLLGLALGGDYEQALTTPVTDYFKGQGITFGAGVEAVTLQHILTMTAGLEWDEWTLPYSDPRNDEHQLHLVEDPTALVLGRRVIDPPGTVWKYSGGLTELLGTIVEQKTGKRLDVYAAEALFGPMGITSFEWLGSSNWRSQGKPSASSGLRMRARDLAKIGSLFLHNGVWDNQQIISPQWLKLSSQRHVNEVDRWGPGNFGYGFQWWPGHSNSIPNYKVIAGFGNGGQQLLVVPEHHLAVTVFAGNYNRYGQWIFNWMLGRIVPAHRKHG